MPVYSDAWRSKEGITGASSCNALHQALAPRNAKRSGLGKINDAVSNLERPADVADRAVPGLWPLGEESITCRLIGR